MFMAGHRTPLLIGGGGKEVYLSHKHILFKMVNTSRMNTYSVKSQFVFAFISPSLCGAEIFSKWLGPGVYPEKRIRGGLFICNRTCYSCRRKG